MPNRLRRASGRGVHATPSLVAALRHGSAGQHFPDRMNIVMPAEAAVNPALRPDSRDTVIAVITAATTAGAHGSSSAAARARRPLGEGRQQIRQRRRALHRSDRFARPVRRAEQHEALRRHRRRPRRPPRWRSAAAPANIVRAARPAVRTRRRSSARAAARSAPGTAPARSSLPTTCTSASSWRRTRRRSPAVRARTSRRSRCRSIIQHPAIASR